MISEFQEEDIPPSRERPIPVMNEALSLNRKTTASVTSCRSQNFFSGILDNKASLILLSDQIVPFSSVFNTVGLTQLIRIPKEASSKAAALVYPSNPALEAQ